MRVAQKFAGYSLAEADNLRKAVRQEDPRDDGQGTRSRFEAGVVERPGYGEVLGKQLFDIIEKFADYAFNKSHTFGYGLVTYQTAYLKAHYPVEYLACLLTSVKSNLDKAAIYLSDCRSMGDQGAAARRQPVDVELRRAGPDRACRRGVRCRSAARVRSRSGCRRSATSARRLVELLIAERDENGQFTSFHDFVERVPEPVLNKRTIESLIKGGAFDTLGHTRRGLLTVFEHIIDTTVKRRREREKGVMSLFGDWGDEAEADASSGDGFDERTEIPELEFDKTEQLRYEKEMLGLYVSDHPLFGVEAALRRKVEHSVLDLQTDGRRRQRGRRRRHHEPGPQVHQEGRPDGGLPAGGPRRVDRGDDLPPHARRAGPQARRRPHRGRQGPTRPARRIALRPHRPDGHRPVRARPTGRRRRCGSGCRRRRSTNSRSSV